MTKATELTRGEHEETRHQLTRPYVLGGRAATAPFGLDPTPLEQTPTDTVAWWRGRTPVTSG